MLARQRLNQCLPLSWLRTDLGKNFVYHHISKPERQRFSLYEMKMSHAVLKQDKSRCKNIRVSEMSLYLSSSDVKRNFRNST